jgi:hypothetical protein
MQAALPQLREKIAKPIVSVSIRAIISIDYIAIEVFAEGAEQGGKSQV